MKMFLRSILGTLLTSLFLFSCSKDDNYFEVDETITVGGLLSITGNWSTLGKTSQAAMEIATAEINTYLQTTGSPYSFATKIYDTKLESPLATKAITDAKAEDIQFIIGPQSSAEVGAVKSFADANNMLVISQGSTAGAYAIAGDNIFRFCPADNVEGPAMAKSIFKAGKKGIITIARNDAGNKGLQTAVSTAFTALGGAVATIAPYAETATDFTAVLAELKTKIAAYTTLYGAAGTAVYYASFDECVALFKQAAADPVFASVNWYGGDGVVLSTAVTADTDAADFAAKTNFFAPNFGLPSQTDPKSQALMANIKTRTGIDADAFALAAYDAMWVIANTVVASSNVSQDFAKVKSIFNTQANSYYGVTGATLLNEFGDRSMGSFDYWGIVKEGATYKWKLVGKSE
jgi:branched-chain amino acid transport system substrate-binding protein